MTYKVLITKVVNGVEFVKWFEVTEHYDDMKEYVDEFMQENPVSLNQEWHVTEEEGFPSYLSLDLKFLCDWLYLKNRSHYDIDLIWEYYDHSSCNDLVEAEAQLEERYAGHAQTKEEWCEQFLNETGVLEGLTDDLKRYFDYESYVRDLEMSGDVEFYYVNGEWHAIWAS